MHYYVNPASTYTIAILFPVLCSIFVGLRFLSRKQMHAGYGPDDWMAIAALVFTIGCGVVLIIGAATHTIGWQSPPQTVGESFAKTTSLLTLNAKLQFSFFPLMVTAIGLIRLTIALLYRRIFRGRAFSIANWTIIGIIVCWTVAFNFATLFQCAPNFWAFWSSEADFAKYCPGDFELNSGLSLADVVIDIALLILPIKPVLNLNMNRTRKSLVLIVFALGIFSIAAGLTRMILLMEVLTYKYGSNNKLFGLPGTSDPLGIVGTALWWSYMEIGVGCLVSNLPSSMNTLLSRENNPIRSLIERVSLNSLHRFKSRSSRNPSIEDQIPPAVQGRQKERKENQFPDDDGQTSDDMTATDSRW